MNFSYVLIPSFKPFLYEMSKLCESTFRKLEFTSRYLDIVLVPSFKDVLNYMK